MHVDGHPDTDVWQRFHQVNGTSQFWNQSHVGDVIEMRGGLAVNIGARVGGLAAGGEVLVSRTVKDLVAGSGLSFETRGTHSLKDVGEWELYAARPDRA